MTALEQPLRQRIAAAIVADLKKAIPPLEIAPGHSIGGMGRTEYDVADAVLAVVQPDLDARDARAYQRGLLKAAEILDAIANTQAMSDPDEPAQTDAEHTRSSARAIRIYVARTARPSCPDPIEFDHEAALGQAQEENARLRAELAQAQAERHQYYTALQGVSRRAARATTEETR